MPSVTTPLPVGKSLPEKSWEFDGFNLGNDTFSLATEAKPKSLVQMTNVELYGKRSVRPRRGGSKLGGSLGGNRVDGLFQYKDGDTNEILGISGGELRKYNSATSAWLTVSGATFETDLRTRATKMRSNLYFGNNTDPFTKYDGTSLAQFTAVAAPTGLAVAQQGTTGVTPYGYQVTTVTSKGESLPSAVVSITNGNETLNATDFARVTFNRVADAQVIGYNLYGRSEQEGGGLRLMKFIPQPSSGNLTFDDDGTLTPQVWLPQDGDSTDGITLEIWEQLKGSLVGGKDPNSPHRLYYSGTGDKYESFSPSHNGGWADVRPGDNDIGINGLAPFESRIIVAKQNSIHQFYFSTDTGDAVLQELITYVGCGAPGSMVVMENDIAFLDSERKLRILGYEPNFQAAIRTTSLSEGRVQSLYSEIDPAYISNCEGVYHKGQYLLACTGQGASVNDRVLVYDRRYLAFTGKHTGTNARVGCWQVWDGKDGERRLYAGSSDSPYVFEYGVEGTLTDHDGSTVAPIIRTRNEDLGNSGQQKIWKWVDLRLFRVSGTVKLTTILDGVNTLDTKAFTSRTSTGWGIAQWGSVRWGVSTGEGADASNLDKTIRKEIFEVGNSLQFELTKTGSQDDFILVSMRGEAFLLPTEVFNSQNYI